MNPTSAKPLIFYVDDDRVVLRILDKQKAGA